MEARNVLMPELLPKDRLQYLKDNCHSTEERKYQKPLTQEELDLKRETATENMIKLSGLQEELDKIKKEFKKQMEPIQTEQVTLLTEVRTKQESVKGVLYNFDNQETGYMVSYDENGDEIAMRRLYPEERQVNIFQAIRGEKAVNE